MSRHIVNFDLESFGRPKRMTPEQKEKHDFMIYLLWESGRFTNQKIGALFGLTLEHLKTGLISGVRFTAGQ